MTNFRVGRPSACVPSALALLLGFFSSLPLNAQQQQTTPAATRITQKINETALVALHGNTHPLAQPKNDIGAAPGSKVAGRLVLVLARSAAQEASLQTWLSSLQDANSPNFHKWMTPDEFGKSFGVSDADLATVEGWLQGHGFSVNKVSPSRMFIEFSGTTAQIEATFHTSVHKYLVNGVQHWANTSDPQIPAALAPVVAGVAKLNDFNPRSTAIRGPSGVYNAATKRIEPSYTFGDTSNGYYIFLGPADAATIYDTPTTYNANHGGTLYDGTGVTIGIAGDSNIDVTQNANYRATFGLPAKATTVVVDGDDPGENGDAIEAYLDTQVATGIAPNANVVLYTAADTYLAAGLFLAISRAIDDNQVDILNVSFGGCEADQGVSGNQYIYDLSQQAAAQGISVTVSTGDAGSAGCDNENTEYQASLGLAVNGLASTPYTIAVGGTDFDTLYSAFPTSFTQYVDITNTLANHRSAKSYIPERPWNDSTFQDDNTTISANVPWTATQYSSNANIVGGGGGFSACVLQSGGVCTAGYPVPSWQSGFAVTASGRNMPDVSFLAGNGLYGAAWGLCTDQDYNSSGTLLTDCAGDPTTGNNFNLTGVGGTSASAPAFAGMLALVKQKVGSRLGQADFVLYDLAKTKYSSVFHDVSTGNNSVACTAGTSGCQQNALGYYFMSGYNATAGFDEASGLGSVDVSQLASNWASAGLVATTSSLTLNGSTAALNITHGASVAVSVGVTGSGGTPGGDVALVDNINPALVPNSGSITSFMLASGVASGTTDFLPGGSYNVSAHYGGSESFAESDSNAIPVTVSAEPSTTSLVIQGYYDPASGSLSATPYYGYVYFLDAQPYGNSASSANPNGAATGTITFKSGSTTVGTAALASDGIAELETFTIPAGNDSLTAVFPGDASFQASTSAPQSLAVVPMPTTIALTNSASGTINLGTSVTITAKLESSLNNQNLDSLGAAPTGTITFTDQTANTTLAALPVTGTAGSSTAFATGGATYTTTTLGAGSHVIAVSYSGDGNYAATQQSASTMVTVNGLTAAMTVTPAPSPVKTNQALQVTVTLAQSGSNPVPTGTASLTAYQNSAQVFSASGVALVNGSASFTIPANTLSIGTVGINAVYSGDKTYNSVNAPLLNVQVVASGTLTPTVSLAPPSGAQTSYPVSIPITVTGPSGDPTPTGSVSLNVGSAIWGPQALVNGSAIIGIPFGLQPGPNSMTVTYTGDTNYSGGSGTGTVTEIAPAALSFTPVNPTVAVNQSLAVTVAVAPVTNVATATGTITLSSGTYQSAATALAGGSASITIPANSLAQGSGTLTAVYSGDSNYSSATSSESITVTAAAPPGLTLSGSNGAKVTVAPGATTGNTSTITVTPTGGFTGTVNLSAALTVSPSGATDLPTLSFGTTSPITISDANSQTATLTITTTAPVTASLAPAVPPAAHWRPGAIAFASVLLLGIGAIRRRWRSALTMLLLLVVLAGGAISCGGGGGGGGGGQSDPGTTAGNYTITVTATSGTVTGTTTINLVVN